MEQKIPDCPNCGSCRVEVIDSDSDGEKYVYSTVECRSCHYPFAIINDIVSGELVESPDE